jgi:hypothetical protein
MIRKEFGSDLSFLPSILQKEKTDDIRSYFLNSSLYFSGRAALYYIILKGIETHGWSKIFMPEYYCHDVTDFISALNIDVVYYENGPISTNCALNKDMDKKEHVVLVVNVFGLVGFPDLDFSFASVIEDHTHDLIADRAIQSKADFCFASLRKTIPIPCGGIAWSPKGLELLEPKESRVATIASYMKFSAMLLKSQYINGDNVHKADFRELYMESEDMFLDKESHGGMPDIFIRQLGQISLAQLNKVKLENLDELYRLINNKAIIFKKNYRPGDHPLGLILKFESYEDKISMQKHLISNQIYPAVLWPKQKADKAKDFSDRMLFVHCDIRYNKYNMNYMAQVINTNI